MMENSSIKMQKLIHKGAEASISCGYWFGKDAIFKQRIPKKYRIEQIDKQLRTSRTLNEARALIKVKVYGINVPQIYEIDVDSSTIIMKYIRGDKLKTVISDLNDNLRATYLSTIGTYIARLHQNGHIHGDITTSNIIITPSDDIFLIDFGLHEYSDKVEDKSVDLHLFKRVLVSSHGEISNACFKAFLEGYAHEHSKNHSNDHVQVIKNVKIIESRGRYIKQEDRK